MARDKLKMPLKRLGVNVLPPHIVQPFEPLTRAAMIGQPEGHRRTDGVRKRGGEGGAFEIESQFAGSSSELILGYHTALT